MKTLCSLSFLLLATIINLSAQSAQDYLDQAAEAAEKNQLPAAIAHLEEAISTDSVSPDVFYYLAVYQASKGDAQLIYDIFTAGISVFPEDYHLHNERGTFLNSIQQFEYAIEDYTKAIELADNDTLKYRAVNNRAASKLNLRAYESAYEDLLVAYEYNPLDLGVLNNLGTVCDEIGRGDETLKYLLKVIEIDSSYLPGYVNIGFKYQEMEQYANSLPYFDKVIELNKNEPLGYSNRSYSKYMLGDLQGAEEDINRSIKLYPINAYAYRVRCLIYLQQGKTEEACADIESALENRFTDMYGDEMLKLQKEHCR